MMSCGLAYGLRGIQYDKAIFRGFKHSARHGIEDVGQTLLAVENGGRGTAASEGEDLLSAWIGKRDVRALPVQHIKCSGDCRITDGEADVGQRTTPHRRIPLLETDIRAEDIAVEHEIRRLKERNKKLCARRTRGKREDKNCCS